METRSIESTTCDCCDQQTHHISLGLEDISYDPEMGFTLHLTTDELVALRAQLGAYL